MSALRLAVRGLLRSPELAFAALLTLIIASGANTAVLAVGAATVFRPLPFAEPDRLVELQVSARSESGTELGRWSYPLFEGLRAAQVVDGVAVFSDFNVTVIDRGGAERLPVELVTPEYFQVLGLAPLLGRAPEGSGEVMLSHALWRERYGSDPAVLGTTLGINRKLTGTVVGVAPEAFAGLTGSAQAWLPLEDAPQLAWSQALSPTSSWLQAVGRLRAGTTLAATQGQLTRVFAEIDDPRFKTDGRAATAVPLEETLLDPGLRRAVLAVLAASALLLLAACANLANLLLARSASRARETAVQVALGASFRELLKQHAATAILLGVLGAAGGALLAQWGVDALLALAPPAEASTPFWRDLTQRPIHLGGAVLGVAAAEALLITLIAALPAALGASRVRVADALQGQAARGSPRLSVTSGRGALVIVQVALAIALAAGAALLVRTFERLRSFEPGFESAGAVALRLHMPSADYRGEAQFRFLEEALRRASALPGVAAASVDRCLPLSGGCDRTLVTAISGRAPFPESERPEIGVHFVAPRHFELLRIPVRSGRGLAEGDRAGAAKVVVLNQTAARRLFGDADPIGQRLEGGLGMLEPGESAEIVGVVGDVRYGEAHQGARPEVYVSAYQDGFPGTWLLLRPRAGMDPLSVAAAMRGELSAIDPQLAVSAPRLLDDVVLDSTSKQRFAAVLFGVFAGLALLLAAAGLSGVLAVSVARRSHEIGVRLALGASRGGVVRMILGESLRLVSAGTALGLTAAWAGARLLEGLLYGAPAADPLAFTGAAVVLFVIALVASLVPSLRAARLDPLAAIRAE